MATLLSTEIPPPGAPEWALDTQPPSRIHKFSVRRPWPIHGRLGVSPADSCRCVVMLDRPTRSAGRRPDDTLASVLVLAAASARSLPYPRDLSPDLGPRPASRQIRSAPSVV